MRSLTYFIAVSLDGFIAAPDGGFANFPVTGDHIDMLAREYPETLPGHLWPVLGISSPGSTFDTVLMGWNTYAIGLPYGVTDPYPHLRQVVFTNRRDQQAGTITFTAENPVSLVRQLKVAPGESSIWLCGGGMLAASLYDEIDQLVLKVNPVILGAGKPLFTGTGYSPAAFSLVDSAAYASGVVVNRYQRR
jgi:dihydrofolate reductase